MAVDSTLISGIATAAATVAAASFGIIGRRRNRTEGDSNGGVSLTKQVMSDYQRREERDRRRVRELEEQLERVRAERDQYRHELDYAQARISQLGQDGV